MMKRVVVLASLFLVYVSSYAQQQEITVYDWEGYKVPEVIAQFEKETGIKVNYNVLASNMQTESIVSGASGVADVIVPTHYIVSEWIKNNKLTPIDKSQLHNYGNLNREYLMKMRPFDEGNKYAIPYIAGLDTLAVKQQKVMELFGGNIPATWGLLFDEKYASKLADCGIAISGSPHRTYNALMLYKATSFTSLNHSLVSSATNEMISLKKYINSLGANELGRGVKSDSVCAAFIRSSRIKHLGNDFLLLQLEEGMTMGLDVMVIPANAKNVAGAYKYIDFLLRPDIAAKIVNSTGYAITTLNGVKELVNPEIANNPLAFPSARDLRRMFMLSSLNDAEKELLTKEWQRFKDAKP